MPRRPEIGNIQLYPDRPLRTSDKNGYTLKFFCPIRKKRVRKNCGTRDRREARRIMRECQERLLSGDYAASGGAITKAHVAMPGPRGPVASGSESKTWTECYDRYRENRATRIRESSLEDLVSRLRIAERIFEGYRADRGLPEGLHVTEVMTLEMLEYLQDRLLAGDEGRYDVRSPNTVNSMMRAVMAFVRFCHARSWIPSMPRVEQFAVEEVMKGRPVTGEEFDRMLEVTPQVVGKQPAASWQFALRILWESAFRVGDLVDFSWDDTRHIHPKWPSRTGEHPTIIIPSSQKNGRVQEIPMLPGMADLLNSVPDRLRKKWIADPLPTSRSRKSPGRLTKECVSRVIAMIGKAAGVIVRNEDSRTGHRQKFASAHDLRRGCAKRLINLGVSAETLKLIMRHSSFSTTERHYGALRSAQAAANEVADKLTHAQKVALVGGLMGGIDDVSQLTAEELLKLKSLLKAL